MSMAVRTKPKRKPAKLAARRTPRRRAKPKSRASTRTHGLAPAPIVVIGRRRKLVHWQTGEVHRDAAGNVVTWDSTDPAAETALLAKAETGVGWALVPAGYQFCDKGSEGRVWR
ncbi:MAG: hypothetical protein DCC68_25425 [Planctomycetota bacterium]|nr:MAG: hypothetical protein DCC68_25425 [Planctomycetota bacterium]